MEWCDICWLSLFTDAGIPGSRMTIKDTIWEWERKERIVDNLCILGN